MNIRIRSIQPRKHLSHDEPLNEHDMMHWRETTRNSTPGDSDNEGIWITIESNVVGRQTQGRQR